ncbi:hypothetical protein [Granulicella sp. L60]|uniref:hypothetical protein n=1 Tax=Granulicella sp. L60 TaxID=1641866 RepID=UPI00131B270F|nr:hypothetical protein [Granulicella sp. L60]
MSTPSPDRKPIEIPMDLSMTVESLKYRISRRSKRRLDNLTPPPPQPAAIPACGYITDSHDL